jgi:hypothetical protein
MHSSPLKNQVGRTRFTTMRIIHGLAPVKSQFVFLICFLLGVTKSCEVLLGIRSSFIKQAPSQPRVIRESLAVILAGQISYMKIIPYIRFFWAASLTFNYIKQTKLDIQEAGDIGLFFTVLGGLLTFAFVSYCIVIGLQEIKDRQLIEAKYFESFGLIFETLVFAGGLYLLVILLRHQSDFWRIGLVILWQLGLLTLLIIDIKRVRTS